MNNLELTFNFTKSKQEEENIIIFLHGYGSDKEDMSQLVPLFTRSTHTSFYVPDAPFPCEQGFGKQWFPLIFSNDDITIRSIDDVILADKYLQSFIAKIQEKHGIPANKIAILGFSQGGVVSLFHGLYNKNTYSGIICHSGLLQETNIADINKNQNIMLIHGRQDDVVNFNNTEATESFLEKHQIIYTKYYKDSLGHSMDLDTITQVEEFFLQCFEK